VEDILADIDADHSDCCVAFAGIGGSWAPVNVAPGEMGTPPVHPITGDALPKRERPSSIDMDTWLGLFHSSQRGDWTATF